MKVKRAVILAAGLGTRFFPIAKSVDKEMLPIIDKPCIQYLVEEAVQSGIKEIIFIINSPDSLIKKYFTGSKRLHQVLLKKNKKDISLQIKKIEKIAKFIFVIQKKPLGDGHAILCAKQYIKHEPFAALFGDDLYHYKIPPLKQLLQKFNKTGSPVIALKKIDKKDSNKYGMAKLGQNNMVQQLVEKPAPKKAPSDLAITGKYIITPELFNDLQNSKPEKKDKELRLIDGLKTFLKHSEIYGMEIKGQRFDTGDKLEYIKAVINFGLKSRQFGKEIKKYIAALDF
ncbi:UTP--glucose-1-phosphate uridylyltransferase [Candidatus Peregrinibacteria bacterium]|nr:UTP--glucose-1-phosphate uridylyltransferase [Candidatus Peregrinibacteria bacterium]